LTKLYVVNRTLSIDRLNILVGATQHGREVGDPPVPSHDVLNLTNIFSCIWTIPNGPKLCRSPLLLARKIYPFGWGLPCRKPSGVSVSVRISPHT